MAPATQGLYVYVIIIKHLTGHQGTFFESFRLARAAGEVPRGVFFESAVATGDLEFPVFLDIVVLLFLFIRNF